MGMEGVWYIAEETRQDDKGRRGGKWKRATWEGGANTISTDTARPPMGMDGIEGTECMEERITWG